MAEQADHDGLRSLILIARSKNAFWERRLHEAAAHARRGLEYAPATSARVLLARQLGDAYQELGDIERATEAHQIAARVRDEIVAPDEIGGIWACGPARQANYAVWVHLRAGNPDAALAAVDTAERAYADGDQWAYGTWAQIRIGAGTAHLMADRLDGTSEALAPILEMPAEERLATLSSRLGDVAGMLNQRRYASSPEARALRDQIADYHTNAMTTKALPPGEQ
jgi:tetratricopeptide (TPR) repeat protein